MQFNFWLKVSRATFLKCFYLERLVVVFFLARAGRWTSLETLQIIESLSSSWAVSPNFLQLLNLEMSGSLLPSAFLNPSVEPLDHGEGARLRPGGRVRHKSDILPEWQLFWDWPKASHITAICIRVEELFIFIPCLTLILPCLSKGFNGRGSEASLPYQF